ncbi:MAG: nitroreductase [Cyclobacteriaceae bacterium]|jgi:nitroreductase
MYKRIHASMEKMMTTTQLEMEIETRNKVHELIAHRWSPRAFKTDMIPDEELFSLFEAARWAASSMNEQPWRFIYARKGEGAYDKIVASLMDGNKPWAKEASVLIATVVKTTFARNNNPNGSAIHDLGLAVGNMSLQATSLGIGVHQIGGFHRDMIREQFDLPTDYAPVTVLALGYFGDADQLPDGLRERERAIRTRKPLEEIAFHGTFK